MAFYRKTGLTLIELLVAVAIIAGVAGFVFITFVSLQNNQALDKQVKVVTAVLDEARSLTLAAQDNSQYGVHFATTSATLFKGATYSQGATDNQVYDFHSLVIISDIALIGGVTDVVFEKLTGTTPNSGTITITTKRGDESQEISISSTGVVSAQ